MRLLALVLGILGVAAPLVAADAPGVEQQVAEAIKSPGVTIVHLWAPWCPNCKTELQNNGWAGFIAANPKVNFVFVTVWRGDKGDGRDLLERNGVGPQPNFKLLVHPNGSRKRDERMTEFLGLPVTWIPSTWVFRGGTLYYALNYGELRFSMLQQLIADSSDKWEH